MSSAPKARPKSSRKPVKLGATYRGVQLQAISGRSRFTRDQIKKAVETAIAKNSNELVRGN